MIKNVHKAVTDYAEAYRQADQVYKQAVKHIKDNYKEGTELYNSAMKTAKNTLNEAIKPIKNTCVKQVQADFEEVRKAIRKAVTTPVSADIQTLLPMIREGKLTDTELQMILGDTHRNYMDQKFLHDAMGKQFTTVEELMGRIDGLEAGLKGYFESFAGEGMDRISYSNALILNGSMINSVDTLTDEFVSAYTDQGFDNKG